MDEIKFPCCIECHYGREMHTHKVEYTDTAKWTYQDCDESTVENDVFYKVWLNTKSLSQISASTETTVYHFEKVPHEILEKKKAWDEYLASKEPLPAN